MGAQSSGVSMLAEGALGANGDAAGAVMKNIADPAGAVGEAAKAIGGLDHFHFISRGKTERQLRIVHFVGEERVNDTYEYDLEFWSPSEDPTGLLEAELLGNPGSLVMLETGVVPRVAHGIVTAYGVLDAHDRMSTRIRVTLQPKLALLKLRRQSRIFQDMSIPEIVGALLKDWNVAYKFELTETYTRRTYSTQYDETDFDFIKRLLTREGIFFYFRQNYDEQREEVIFTDEAVYKPVAGENDTRFHLSGGNYAEANMLEVGIKRQVHHFAARAGDYDFRNPQLPLRDQKTHPEPPGVFAELGADKFVHYIHGHEGEHESAQSAKRRDVDVSRALDGHRAAGVVVVGKSRMRSLLPGYWFTLEGHQFDSLNREWVITSVRHEGFAPEFDQADEIYKNEFTAVPNDTPLRMAPEGRRRIVHATETATVVGASEGELLTDAHGRIKVQFHWDLEGKKDERSSTWIRVAQPWSGPGFGTQFLPRAGAEVIVTFLDGDPDRPLVVGSVYNGTNPTPFGLPQSSTRSGIRTMSTPGGAGGNELSFEDKANAEQMLIKAQRDFDTEVGNDQSVTVKRNATQRVEGQLTEHVTGTHTVTVVGGQTNLVSLHRTSQIMGDAIDTVRGNADRRITGDDNLRVEGTVRHELAAADLRVHGDTVQRYQGHVATIVGAEGAHRSASVHVQGTAAVYSTSATEIISEKEVVIRVGRSSLRIGPDSVQILSPQILFSGENMEVGMSETVTMVAAKDTKIKAERVNVNGKGASLLLMDDADIYGTKVKLNCTVEEAAVIGKDKPLTSIVLTDEDGTPAARRRYVVVTSKGERSGMLDDQGKASLELDEGDKIYFPDVDNARDA